MRAACWLQSATLPLLVRAQLEAPPPTPVPTPSPGFGDVIVDFYADKGCTESELLYTVRFPNADGVCKLSGRDWYVEGPGGGPIGGAVNIWGAAFCDFRRQELFMQTAVGHDIKSCRKVIPNPDAIGGLSTSYKVALDDSTVHDCKVWEMPDPNAKDVTWSLSTQLRPGSCVPPSSPPGPSNTPKPGVSPPSVCDPWPKDDTYTCTGTPIQLSNSGVQDECTVECLDKTTQLGKEICCYLADVGCFAFVDSKVQHGKGDVGKAVVCHPTHIPGPGPGPGPPWTPGDHSGSHSNKAVIIGCSVAGAAVLLGVSVGIAVYLLRKHRDGGGGEGGAGDGGSVLDSLRELCAGCRCLRCCSREEEEAEVHQNAFAQQQPKAYYGGDAAGDQDDGEPAWRRAVDRVRECFRRSEKEEEEEASGGGYFR
eukprot:TRINITY_DN685_c4_g2_i1.p1 TRINITY_DN685_c4_g2~~TRINITY_DN685_c4_g2_i1.p1  ORF type:complete len:423 (+),score=53.72 TRINITY_DN685_c4_g2_i1:71-1339(+)